jgi:hypothetical protein
MRTHGVTNHALFHAGQPTTRVFPESSRLPAPPAQRRERQCGLLWGHCFHAVSEMIQWECCMCARSVDGWPADQCTICSQDEKIGTVR